MFSIVIPNYNGKEMLEQCLESIAKNLKLQITRYPPAIAGAQARRAGKTICWRDNPCPGWTGLPAQAGKLQIPNKYNLLEIIVVDNGSTDGSREWLRDWEKGRDGGNKGNKENKGNIENREDKENKKNREDRKVIFNKKNLGFAAAVNQGARAAKNDYLAVLNNDVKIKSDWLKTMSRAIKRWQKKEKVGCFCGKVLTWDGKRLEGAGLAYQVKGKAINRGNGEVDSSRQYHREEIVFGAAAAAAVYRREAFLSAGGFDQDFFAYLEDVDLSLRLNNQGWRTVYVPRAISFHRGGATSDKIKGLRRRADAQNWWFIIIKNYPLSVIIRHSPEIFLERLKNAAGLVKELGPRGLLALAAAEAGVAIKMKRILKKRKPLESSWF